MAEELSGKRIAFLVANEGVEQVELTSPWGAVKSAGATPTLIAPEKSTVQAVEGDIHPSDTFDADLAVADADVDDYDALVLPGGVANPDALRIDDDAVAFVKAFTDARKPIAAICHAPWTLVEAGVVDGKHLASWPSLQTDIRNAGGTWHDVEVYTCHANGWTLVSSRKPDDLDAFNAGLIKAFAI